jgi:hypothetical protein
VRQSDGQEGLGPDGVTPPAPRVDRDAEAGYRSVAFVMPPIAEPLPSAFLDAWWASFIVSTGSSPRRG